MDRAELRRLHVEIPPGRCKECYGLEDWPCQMLRTLDALDKAERREAALRVALEKYADNANWRNDDWGVQAVWIGPDGVGYADASAIARIALQETPRAG